MTLTGPQDEALAEDSDLGDRDLRWVIEHIAVVLLHLVVVADGANHEQLPAISANEYLGLVEPAVHCEVPILGQLLYLLCGLEGVILHLVELEQVLAAH